MYAIHDPLIEGPTQRPALSGVVQGFHLMASRPADQLMLSANVVFTAGRPSSTRSGSSLS
ncbi:hypothetical protein PAHAL_8G112100 [Panicum hallii]|uniref:Uncharacterized protein n=1 Tax=Panicum hallii TaxID=206008 RepID=A0A2T8I8H5_9POAL|nr:hypothetical protein PAHAL_8G112100 [Panicum hallii]